MEKENTSHILFKSLRINLNTLILNPLILFLGLSAFISAPAYSQKQDFIWTFGTVKSNDSSSRQGACNFDFNVAPPTSYRVDRFENFQLTVGSYCTTTGKLICYTNGCVILDKNHVVMENGDSINSGYVWDLNCTGNYPGYNLPNTALFLDFPFSDSLFFIHQRIDFEEGQSWEEINFSILLSIININANDGLGKVDSKNKLLFQDKLRHGNILCTKHANGRDWWLIFSTINSNKFYKILFSTNGQYSTTIQYFGPTYEDGRSWRRETDFSPDGSMFVDHDTYGGSHLYDFDRCTGEIYNHRELFIPLQIDSARTIGACFSPNSRFLYLSNQRSIYQFDLFSNDIQSTRELVASYEPFFSPFPTVFFLMERGPDGKIYMNTPNGNDVLHVINFPNKKGKDCDVVQNDVKLAARNAFQMPSFPPYRLGPLLGSSCDTLSKEQSKDFEINLYPNPVSSELRIDILEGPKIPLQIIFFDVTGKKIHEEPLRNLRETEIIDTRRFPQGMLLFVITEGSGSVVESGKLLKM